LIRLYHLFFYRKHPCERGDGRSRHLARRCSWLMLPGSVVGGGCAVQHRRLRATRCGSFCARGIIQSSMPKFPIHPRVLNSGL
jgi:hypothetical protein